MSERTALINMFVGLCTSDTGWPSTLHDLGYCIKAVNGHTTTDDDGQPARADVVAASDRTNHVLIAYYADEEGANPEPNITSKEPKIQRLAEYVKDQGMGKMSYTACRISTEANGDERASLPRIIFGQNAIRGSGDFGHQRINDAFENAIPLDGAYPPRNYYTLSQDNKSFLLDKVCAAIISISTQKGEMPRPPLTDPDILERIISDMYPAGEADTARIESLRKKVAEIIDDATANYGLDPNITTGKPRASTTRKVKGAFKRMSDDYKSQPRIDEM